MCSALHISPGAYSDRPADVAYHIGASSSAGSVEGLYLKVNLLHFRSKPIRVYTMRDIAAHSAGVA